jgi:hypothetical protein
MALPIFRVNCRGRDDDKSYGRKKELIESMQISDREIRESLRLLAEQPIGTEKMTEIDQKTSRMVLSSLKKLPDVRIDIVMPLRTAVRESRYDVPGEEVAKQLLGRCFADHLR